jgi:hypothetical protein
MSWLIITNRLASDLSRVEVAAHVVSRWKLSSRWQCGITDVLLEPGSILRLGPIHQQQKHRDGGIDTTMSCNIAEIKLAPDFLH